VSVLEHSGNQGKSRNRRQGGDRRAGERRAASRTSVGSEAGGRTEECRRRERRHDGRRVDDVPFLFCPDCCGPLQYEAGLSWSLPGTYTVDAGACPSCARRFLRNRETGEYDELSW
jgi:hypothetical protein